MKVFAGDSFNSPSDASYRNLLWENLPVPLPVEHSFNIWNKIERKKEIGTIKSWGPFFRISLDLIIHYHNNDVSNVLSFKGNGARRPCCDFGDRIPIINIRYQQLHFATSVNGKPNHVFDFPFNLNTWYNIIIEQKFLNRRVRKR